MEFSTALKGLGSLRLTIVTLLVLLAAVVVIYVYDEIPSNVLAAPLGILAVNLLAAILTNSVFRRQTALLAFHIALLTLVVLLAVGRLTYLKGTAELADGEEFSGSFIEFQTGPLHPTEKLKSVRFTNRGFRIKYAPGPLRQLIHNTVEVPSVAGVARRMEITEHDPLILSGYRFYPTGNKGFAPTFLWQPTEGKPVTVGAVHLPSYPMHEHEQAREWTPPGSRLRIWTMLNFDEVILDPDRPSEFHMPSRHSVVLRIGDQRWELQPGGSIVLPEGRLVYQELRGWMGYEVFYEWTMPWLLAACLAAVSALAAHFWLKFAAKPWNE